MERNSQDHLNAELAELRQRLAELEIEQNDHLPCAAYPPGIGDGHLGAAGRDFDVIRSGRELGPDLDPLVIG